MSRSNLKLFALCIERVMKEPQTVPALVAGLHTSRDTVQRHLLVLEELEMARRIKVPGQRAERWEWIQ